MSRAGRIALLSAEYSRLECRGVSPFDEGELFFDGGEVFYRTPISRRIADRVARELSILQDLQNEGEEDED